MEEEEEQQKKSSDDSSNTSQLLTEQNKQTIVPDNSESSSSNSSKVKTEPDLDTELSNSPKKQKKIEGNIVESLIQNNIDHQDTSFNEKTVGYCSFSTKDKKQPSEPKTKKSESTQSNPIKQLLNQATVSTSDLGSEEEDEKKKIAAAKKLLFPNALATSFSEIADTLRDERRQEFCPIYKDETPEEIILRQAKQKPVGSLLAKRIHWDDLKRKREEQQQRQAQVPIRYGSYGPIYANQQQSSANSYGQYNRTMQNQPQQSFANPYEQYYAAMQNQYEQMVQIARTQQEYTGFWPEYNQQSSLQNNSNNQPIQNSMQPYTYPYPAMYSTNMPGMNTNIPSSSYTTADYNLYLNSLRQQPPPPPPPDEPYPY